MSVSRWKRSAAVLSNVVLATFGLNTAMNGQVATAAPSSIPAAVYGWAGDYHGELGIGQADADPHYVTPALAPANSGIVSVTGGNQYAVALTNTGGVLAWGDNANGQLGDGTQNDAVTPQAVPGLESGVKQAVANHGSTSYAVKTDGSVVSWGSNYNGELGNGTETGSLTPVAVQGLAGPVDHLTGGGGEALAVMADGTVDAWGTNEYGGLGDGTTTDRPYAAPVPGLSNIVAVGAGYDTSFAIDSSGNLYGWGGNAFGQLANGTTIDVLTPQLISGISNVVSVADYDNTVAALTSDGTAYVWGYGADGELGDGSTNTANEVPTAVSLPSPVAWSQCSRTTTDRSSPGVRA
jgi:alpha-tubulin suppressor-like RCC1 family protein